MRAVSGAASNDTGPIPGGPLRPASSDGRDLCSELTHLALELRDPAALIDDSAAKLAQSGADAPALDPGHAGEVRTHRVSGQACVHASPLGCMPPSA